METFQNIVCGVSCLVFCVFALLGSELTTRARVHKQWDLAAVVGSLAAVCSVLAMANMICFYHLMTMRSP